MKIFFEVEFDDKNYLLNCVENLIDWFKLNLKKMDGVRSVKAYVDSPSASMMLDVPFKEVK